MFDVSPAVDGNWDGSNWDGSEGAQEPNFFWNQPFKFMTEVRFIMFMCLTGAVERVNASYALSLPPPGHFDMRVAKASDYSVRWNTLLARQMSKVWLVLMPTSMCTITFQFASKPQSCSLPLVFP